MSGCPSRILASSSAAEVAGAGALCEGPCAGGLESASAATGGTGRGREMVSTTSPCLPPSLPG